MKLVPILFTASLLLVCNPDKKKDQEYLISEEINHLVFTNQEQKSESYLRGKEIYSDFCVTCHLPSGEGVVGSYPPLAGSNWLVEKTTESLRAIKFGLSGPIIVNGEKYDNRMAPQGLSDQEVADVMNYISNSWGNSAVKEVTTADVKALSK